MAMSGQQLRVFRKARGLTQAEFGELLGLTRFRVCNLERMPEVPKHVELACASVALGVLGYDGEGPIYARGNYPLTPAPLFNKPPTSARSC